MTTRTAVRRFFEPSGAAGLVALSLVVGILVGLSAAALILAVALLDDLIGTHEPSQLVWWVPLVTVPVGLTAAQQLAKRLAPEAAGDGVPETAAALAVRSGYLPTRAFFVKMIATALTIGGGGSAGREGPMVQIGGTIGSKAGRVAGLGEDRIRSLVAAGAGAAIGATFNAPIAGMLFALEVILGAFTIRHLNVVVVTSVTAAVTARTIVGGDRLLSAFAFQLRDARELVLYAILGVLTVITAVTFLRFSDRVESLSLGRLEWLRAPALGLAVAALALMAPEVLGGGQEFVADLVRPIEVEPFVWWALLGMAGLKVVVTSLTLGARGSGGAFMPSLFIGAALGAGFGELLEQVWTISTISPGAFAVVGMAASFAAVARAPLTSILIVFEITGDYGLVLPLMLATSVATVIADRIEPQSIYTMALERMGIRSLRPAEVDLLDTIIVSEVMSKETPSIGPEETTSVAQGLLDRHRSHGLAVVDDQGALVGIVAITDIVRGGGPADQVRVGEVMTPAPVTVPADAEVSYALERMAALGIGRLPVVAPEDPTQLVGMFRREDAVRAYHMALSRRSDHEFSRQRLGRRTGPETEFFEFVVADGSKAAGHPIRQLPWPSGCTVVSVRRGRTVLVPKGDTVLEAGDRLTVYGTEAGRRRLIERVGGPLAPEDASRPDATDIQ